MIRPIDIKLNAAHPELPLVEATTFTGAPSSVFIRGVPKSVGNWSITAVNVAVTYPDNSTTTRAAVESAEGVWVATIPGTATSGRTVAGFRILADGIDENGAAVTGYVLGFADFSVFSFLPVPAPGETYYLLRYFDAMPTTPKKGDVAVVGGVLKYYNGTTWLPFADLTNKADSSSIAELFNPSKQGGYAIGDVVMYNGVRCRCTTAHTGAWDAAHFVAQTVEAAKANDNAVVKLTGEQTVGGDKWFTGHDYFYDLTVSHPQGMGYIRIYALANENRVHIDFSDAVSGSQGELFLPVLGGYGAVTLAAIENLAPDAVPMLSDGATVDLNTLYCYQGCLYRCILGYTFQSGDSYPPNDTTHWTPATVEDVLAALRTGKANTSDLPYAISESIPLTVTSGAASTTLDDRTHNVRTVAAPGSGNTTTITATLPPIVAGKSRDIFLNLTVGTQASDAGDISLSIVEPSGATVQIDIGSSGDIGIGKNEILITENALPTTSGNVTTTHWLVTVRHEDFAS